MIKQYYLYKPYLGGVLGHLALRCLCFEAWPTSSKNNSFLTWSHSNLEGKKIL